MRLDDFYGGQHSDGVIGVGDGLTIKGRKGPTMGTMPRRLRHDGCMG
jgi:hypothetical protein